MKKYEELDEFDEEMSCGKIAAVALCVLVTAMTVAGVVMVLTAWIINSGLV